MDYTVVEAQEGYLGCRIYSNRSTFKDKWVRVTEVKTTKEYTIIQTTDFEVWLHPREAIAIKHAYDIPFN